VDLSEFKHAQADAMRMQFAQVHATACVASAERDVLMSPHTHGTSTPPRHHVHIARHDACGAALRWPCDVMLAITQADSREISVIDLVLIMKLCGVGGGQSEAELSNQKNLMQSKITEIEEVAVFLLFFCSSLFVCCVHDQRDDVRFQTVHVARC
jgi:hypothetical protein